MPGRAGKHSTVDHSDEAPPPLSTRGNRAAKLAVLEDPPWAALKPKSRSKDSKTPVKNAPPVRHKNLDTATKRKRSDSAADEPMPLKKAKPKPPKPRPLPFRPVPNRSVVHKRHRSSSHRAPSIDTDNVDNDSDDRYNDSGDNDIVTKSASHHDTSGTSSAEDESGYVPPETLHAEGARILSRRPSNISQKILFRDELSESGRSSPSSDFAHSFKRGARIVSRRPSNTSQKMLFKVELDESDRSSPTSDCLTVPPTSDFDDVADASEWAGSVKDEEDEASETDSFPKGNLTRRQIKLENERPIIRGSARAEMVKQEKKTRVPVEDTKAWKFVPIEDMKAWKLRTELKTFMKTKKTLAIGLKEQNEEIQQVIHGSYQFGKLALVVGDPDAMLQMSNDAVLKMSSPFAVGGLEKIALASLISAADSSGYDGEYDIAHRLEEGSPQQYIDPLVSYVVQRIAVIRSSFKKCINIVAPGVLGLQSNTHQHNSDLLRNNSFIYPWSAADGFNMSKPFQNSVIAKAVESAFFTAGSQYNDLGLEFAGRLASSSDAEVGQREVSMYMVAMASVGVASVIQDTILGRPTDFTGSQLDSLFKKLIVILLMLRRSKPVAYHKLMHGIYSTVIGEKPVNVASADLTAQEILGEVNWDLIDD